MTPEAPEAPTRSGPWTVLGREITLPVEVRRAAQWGAQYLVPAAAAQRIVDPTGLEVTGPVPGRALAALAACRYDDTDLDGYHEVAVSFVVRPHDAPPRPSTAQRLREFGTGAIGAYIHRLPVDQEFTCVAGRDIWGYPKWMTAITVDEPAPDGGRGTGTTVRLVDDGRHVLTLTVSGGIPLRLPSPRPRATRSGTDCFGAPSGPSTSGACGAGPAGPPWCSATTRWPTSSAPRPPPAGRLLHVGGHHAGLLRCRRGRGHRWPVTDRRR